MCLEWGLDFCLDWTANLSLNTGKQKCRNVQNFLPLLPFTWLISVGHLKFSTAITSYQKPYLTFSPTPKLYKMPLLTSTIIFTPCNYLIICTHLPWKARSVSGLLFVCPVPSPVFDAQQLSEHLLTELGSIICPKSQNCYTAKEG